MASSPIQPRRAQLDLKWQLVTLLVVLVLGAGALTYLRIAGTASSHRESRRPLDLALVANSPATPTVREVRLSKASGAQAGTRMAKRPRPSKQTARTGPTTLTSAPEPVQGLATIGVTWMPQDSRGELRIWGRTKVDGAWSAWTNFDFDADHGPDPQSREGRRARTGTDPVFVGDVDEVQVMLEAARGDALPTDLRLALVDPGTATKARREAPAIAAQTQDRPPAVKMAGASENAEETPARPAIYSRAQWGANERLRDKASLHYGRVRAGFVHHTVNANNYTRDDVPALLRGIYAYHTQARGWSDIGYNFIVDRFGRIWEGRYGGVDRAVVGAHTLGYNDDAFAMSALGNFEKSHPRKVMLDAYARVFAWKLSLHGVAALSRVRADGKRLNAISGHSDADATACPGRYLYAQLPRIRTAAARLQPGWSARQRRADLLPSAGLDLVARRTTTKRAVVWRSEVPDRPLTTGIDLSRVNRILGVGDWDGDGRADFMARRSVDGRLLLYRGMKRLGVRRVSFEGPINTGVSASGLRNLTPAGDLTGDGAQDLLGRNSKDEVVVFPGDGRTGFQRPFAVGQAASRVVVLGLWNSGGAPDLATIGPQGRVAMVTGNGPGLITVTTRVLASVRGYDFVRTVGDVNGDRRPDLVARRVRSDDLWLLLGDRRGFRRPQRLGSGVAAMDLLG